MSLPMKKTVLPILVASLLALGCGRKTEALPRDQALVSPAPENKPKKLFSSEPKATVVKNQELQKETGKEKGFSLPQDKGGKLVGDLLRPAEKSLVEEQTKKRLAGPTFVEQPEILLPPYKGMPPKLAVKDSGKPVRPRSAQEETPLSRFFGAPQPPYVVKLETAALVKWPMPDPDQALPLPILAQPRPDRAPLSDPTAEASTDAALSGAIPVRQNPAPFLRVNLPNPFENRQTVKVRSPLPEDPTPQTR